MKINLPLRQIKLEWKGMEKIFFLELTEWLESNVRILLATGNAETQSSQLREPFDNIDAAPWR